MGAMAQAIVAVRDRGRDWERGTIRNIQAAYVRERHLLLLLPGFPTLRGAVSPETHRHILSSLIHAVRGLMREGRGNPARSIRMRALRGAFRAEAAMYLLKQRQAA
jgi:hypothetical protein